MLSTAEESKIGLWYPELLEELFDSIIWKGGSKVRCITTNSGFHNPKHGVPVSESGLQATRERYRPEFQNSIQVCG